MRETRASGRILNKSLLSKSPISFFLIYTIIAGSDILFLMQSALHELLGKTEQNILDAEDRIEVQRAIVAKMESAGADVKIARELLRALQQGRLTLAAHREQLRRILSLSVPGTGNHFHRLAVKLFEKSTRPIDDEADNQLPSAYH
jgi:hypothetical protein